MVNKKRDQLTGFALLSLFTLILSDNALAITAPSSGTFLYDIYDIGVNQMLKGGLGFVGGVTAIVVGAVLAIQQKIMGAIPAILGGAAMLKADSIVTSLGAVI